jgi:hypothetical protein
MVPSVNLPAPRETPTVEPHTSFDQVSYLKDHHVRIYVRPSGEGLRRRRER